MRSQPELKSDAQLTEQPRSPWLIVFKGVRVSREVNERNMTENQIIWDFDHHGGDTDFFLSVTENQKRFESKRLT